MADFIIKKTPIYEKQEDGKKKKVGEKDSKYRIDANFIPNKVEEICQEFIDNYCEINNHGDWLLAELDETITTESGKVIPKPFTVIRKDFAKKFFNLPPDNDDGISWRDKMRKKYGDKKENKK